MRYLRPEPGRNRRLGRYSALSNNFQRERACEPRGCSVKGAANTTLAAAGPCARNPIIFGASGVRSAALLVWRGFFYGKCVAQLRDELCVVGQRLFEGDLVPNVQSLGIIPG